MARPAGRYFASLINKIRELKKHETILIDESFKQSLRQNIMMKTGVRMQPQKQGFFERFAFLRHHVALVPSLLLLIVAVAGLSRLPMQFKSQVVTPVMTLENGQGSGQPQPQTADMVQPPVNQAVQQSGVKTFPGRTVLPSSYFQKSAVAIVPMPPSSAGAGQTAPEATAELPVSSARLQFVQPDEGAVSNQNVPTPPIYVQGTADGVQQPYYVQSAPLIVPNPVPAPTVISSALPSTPQANPVEFNQPVREVTGSTPIQTSGLATMPKEISGSTPVTTGSTPVSAPAVLNSTLVQKNTAEINTDAQKIDLNLNNRIDAVILDNARIYSANIYYKDKFSSDEKTVLESDYLPRIIGVKAVDYIAVRQKDASTLVVEVNYQDGGTAVYSLKIDEIGILRLQAGALESMEAAEFSRPVIDSPFTNFNDSFLQR